MSPMRVLKGLGGRMLPCGCLVGTYETYDGRVVTTVDVQSPSCGNPAHRPNQPLELAAQIDPPNGR